MSLNFSGLKQQGIVSQVSAGLPRSDRWWGYWGWSQRWPHSHPGTLFGLLVGLLSPHGLYLLQDVANEIFNTSEDLVSEVAQSHFCCILSAKASQEASPESRGGERGVTSWLREEQQSHTAREWGHRTPFVGAMTVTMHHTIVNNI